MDTTPLFPGLRNIVSSTTQPTAHLLIKGGIIVSMDPQVGNLANGDILIRDGKIVAIGSQLHAEGAEILDASNMIVMPGMIDTHRHAWEGQLRRINPNSSTLEDYCNATHFSFAKYYRPRDMYVGNLLTALGCIDAGITTIIDNSHNARSAEHSDAAVEALLDAGIRAVHAPGAPLAGTWENDQWPRDLGRLKAKYFSGQQSLVTMAMMSQIDRDIWAEARKLDLPIITEFFGRAMAAELDTLLKEGLLGPDNIFNHCTDLPDAAWEILRQAGVRVNVCPRSDAHYALEDGVCSYQSALNHGMKPGLSVDNESSYSGDLFMEMRIAFYLQRSMAQRCRHHGHQHAPAPVMMRDLLAAATIDGAAVAGLADQIGSLSAGKQADLIIIRADDINLYPSNNALGTIVHAAEPGNIDTVIIAGKIRKRFGYLVDLDMSELERATEESREHLFAATGYIPDMFADAFTALAV